MIKTKQDATQVINAAIASHQNSWRMAKTTESYVINMEPPFDDAKLKDKANWSSNWNYGRGRAQAEQIITKNVGEITKAVSLCDIVFENYDKSIHDGKVYEFLTAEEMRSDFSERIGAAFSESVIDKSKRIDSIVRRSEYECTLFGFAAIVKESNEIFPSVIPYCSIAFEDHTDVDDIKTFVVFDIVKGSYLFDIYCNIYEEEDKNESAREYGKQAERYGFENQEHSELEYPEFTSSGWNKEALLSLICEIYNHNEEALSYLGDNKKDEKGEWSRRYTSWEDVSTLSSKMGAYWCRINLNNVHIAKVFEIEEDGKVYESYCAINDRSDSYAALLRSDILFHKISEAPNANKIISLVLDVSVDGSVYIHDIKGNGRMIAENSLRYDINRNTLQDKLMLSGSTWIYAPSGLAERNMDIKVLGGTVMLSQGTEIVQNLIRQDLGDHLNALSLENQEHDRNMSHVKPNIGLSNRPTRDEVNFINSEALSTRMSDFPIKLKSYSNVITNIFHKICSDDEMFSRMNKSIKEDFLSQLRYEFSDLTVSDEDILKILKTVKTVELSPVMSDRDAISSALNVASTATSRKRLTRMFLSTFGFSRKQIKEIMESESYGRDAELAAIENSMFESTREVVFGAGQDHIIHLQAHFYKIDQKLSGVREGEDPVRAHLFITNALTNTKLHVSYIANSVFYKDKAKDYIKAQKTFEQELQNLSSMLDSARQKMSQEQGSSGEPQLDEETKSKFYLDKMKLMEKINNARARTQAMNELKLKSFELDNELKKQRVSEDINRKKEKTQADVDASLAKKSVEMMR
jgi:hypothetical protein